MERKTLLGIFAISMVALFGVSLVAANGFGFNGAGFENEQPSDEQIAEMQVEHEAMQTAIEDGDYSAWKELQEKRVSGMQSQITEENFNSVVERHQNMQEFRDAMQEFRESGDYSEVQELRDQYGSEIGFGFEGKGMRMHFAGANPGCIGADE